MEHVSLGDIVAFVIGYVARTGLLTLLLWLMIKLQKLNYTFLGVLGSAALASLLDSIPYVGHYFAVPVLYLCIWKVTQASLMPDAVFTVAVSYALMFAVNVLLFTALIGDLRPSARIREADEPPPAMEVADDEPAPPGHTNGPPAAARGASVPGKIVMTVHSNRPAIAVTAKSAPSAANKSNVLVIGGATNTTPDATTAGASGANAADS
ncbi:MAG TPA: hypothetical protein VF988_05715, partial [Verrucomicrobiae bacterium]